MYSIFTRTVRIHVRAAPADSIQQTHGFGLLGSSLHHGGVCNTSRVEERYSNHDDAAGTSKRERERERKKESELLCVCYIHQSALLMFGSF